ncbi:D-psicose 3-epimerase [Beauveria bassiana]|uniref:D-tagatose 3-epimerase n=1 Tax=Beauveria bassiana (strain ARSEF 2860) TaxID=655819 RepID=J4KND2_BEAB2|nr:D-tagatose 3-epimerase [Beauveria bassiana ARSEF 2860]EJP65499.1 D-tagatose 3-epimerase [Beauveria bassiana ARSEF 2860]KAF1732928.1 D-psicose 3-epimerase [Beauveria bassiana]KAH8713022.1 D-psicose 3-epimerase [Beauveria bassiana]
MHLAAHTWMRPEPLEKTLDRLSRLGYSGVELAGEPDQYPVEETRALLKKYNINCWGMVTIQQGKRDLIAADPQQRRDSINYVKDVVSLSASLGGQIVTVVPGSVGKMVSTSAPEDEWKWAVEGLREIAALAKDKGIRLGIEPLNRFETYFINRSDQALALADEVGYGVGIAFDPFHLALEEADLLAAIRRCKGRIVDFHVADNNRLAPGDGSFVWEDMIPALAEAGYDGALAIEAMPPVDRTPIGKFGSLQREHGTIEVSADHLKFIQDHGSALLGEEYYTDVMRRSAAKLAPYVEKTEM